MNINIASLHFKARQELKDYAVQYVEKLEKFDSKIMQSNVFLKLENQHTKFNDNDKVAEIIIYSPGHELFASAKSDNFETSIRKACDKIKNQIRHYHEKD